MDREENLVRGVDSNNLPPYDYFADPRLRSESRSGDLWAATEDGDTAFTHVLLAACSEDGLAMEDRESGHGVFTSALLHYLRDGVDMSMTYRKIIQSLEILPHKSG